MKIKNQKTKIKNESGFTLLEVVVAMVILGLAYVAVLQNFSLSLKNIARIERSRAKILTEVLEFEALLVPAEEDEQGEVAKKSDYPLFLEGTFFDLVEVSSSSGDLITLKLEKKQL
jgi:prepilin-type N-terminal cleavage/methylation domain-containing protein